MTFDMAALQVWYIMFKCVKPAGIDLAFNSKTKLFKDFFFHKFLYK